MIYLKPIGGLCNRMRTIDSLISLCKVNRRDLTVLWVNDASLNCNFKELFEIPVFEDFNFQIIDCPIGFPENFLNNKGLLMPNTYSNNFSESYLVRRLKNILKGRSLSEEHKKIIRNLEKLVETQVIINEELSALYASHKYQVNTSVREMDALFIPLIGPLIKPLFSNTSFAYISSCYRMHLLEGEYQSFKPVINIKKKIDEIVKGFSSAVGLHIRRSDHSVSKNVSTTSKFINVANSLIDKNPETEFFLSTDDGITKSELLEKFGNKIKVNEVVSYDRNNENALKDAVVDLYCLSKTRIIYGSHHSSFSQTAADIGSIEEFTVK